MVKSLSWDEIDGRAAWFRKKWENPWGAEPRFTMEFLLIFGKKNDEEFEGNRQ